MRGTPLSDMLEQKGAPRSSRGHWVMGVDIGIVKLFREIRGS